MLSLRPLAVGVATLAVATPAAAHAAGWITGAPLSAPAEIAFTPMAAQAPSGERIVAWERRTPGDTRLGFAVRVAPPGGDFGAAQLIPDAVAFDPSLTVGDDGTAALVWVDFEGVSQVLHVATRAPGRGAF